MTCISSYYMGVRLPEFRLQPEAIDYNSLADPFLEIPLRCQYLIELRCASGKLAHPQTESPIFRIQITRHDRIAFVCLTAFSEELVEPVALVPVFVNSRLHNRGIVEVELLLNDPAGAFDNPGQDIRHSSSYAVTVALLCRICLMLAKIIAANMPSG